MDESPLPKATISSQGRATLRLHPEKLIMLARIRVEEATLELGLSGMKRRCADTALRLKRLGAVSVETGEPHEDDHSETDPMARMQAAMKAKLKNPGEPAVTPRQGVNCSLTASWPIAGMSGEKIFLLVDNLRFDAAADLEPPEPPEEPSDWATPEEQVKTMIAKMQAPPPLDLSPKFLYVSLPTEEQCDATIGEAYRLSCKSAQGLARLAGRRIGELASLNSSSPRIEVISGQHMTRVRCEGLLSAAALPLPREAVVMDTPWPVDLEYTIFTTHYLV